jgi:nitrite reductase/ring-hydroxylating ferredoxin subunit
LEGDVQGTRVTCPWHGADFDLKTGGCFGAASAKGRSKLQSRGRRR